MVTSKDQSVLPYPLVWKPCKMSKGATCATFVACVYPNGAVGTERVDGSDAGCELDGSGARGDAEDFMDARRLYGDPDELNANIVFWRMDVTFQADGKAPVATFVRMESPPDHEFDDDD